MKSEQALLKLTDKCDIYFKDSLISRERIIKKYADYFAYALLNNTNALSVALHTGSVCFEIVSLVIVALASILYDKTDSESIITSLNKGDMVLFKNARYRWCGVNYKDGNKYITLEKDGRGKNGKTTIWVPFENNKNLIKPYCGTSNVTDGRGIKHEKNKRADFLSHVFGISANEIPSITGVSSVIIIERDTFYRLSKDLSIVYGNGKSIGLLDIITASYYTCSGEEYQYGSNPAKTEPVLKVTGNMSTARDLVLDKHGNMTTGLLVMEPSSISKGSFELTDLLERKLLKFIHIAVGINSPCTEDIIKKTKDGPIFACTRRFLMQNTLHLQEINDLTLRLDRQIKNILNNVIITKIVIGCCSWEDLRKAKEALYIIKKSNWNDEEKRFFIITAYSLLNLFITAVFPIKILEKATKNGEFMLGASSIAQKIKKLWDLVYKLESIECHCVYIADFLERLYESGFSKCSKYDVLKQHVKSSHDKKIAIVVPQKYYIDILSNDETINKKNITILTANNFDSSIDYDEVIVVGNFNSKRFDVFKCNTKADIIVLLYECEVHQFQHKREKVEAFERKLNTRLGIEDDNVCYYEDLYNENLKNEDIEAFTQLEKDIEHYINTISSFDIRKFVNGATNTSGNTLTSEVCAIGRFVTGEQILFSRYYNAIVFNSSKGMVSETNIENLEVGDRIVFTKRDDYTKNMVDYIYENLQASGRLSKDILDATEKAYYWKEALREYQDKFHLTYRDIAKKLKKDGCSIHEVTVRQWLIEESHIVGPRDESTLRRIAELTRDPYLLSDTHGYFEACRIVRYQRKQILKLIGEAIMDKLSGHKPTEGSILEVVYDNVENLSETLELEAIKFLEKPVTVSINLINKPITDWEVTI